MRRKVGKTKVISTISGCNHPLQIWFNFEKIISFDSEFSPLSYDDLMQLETRARIKSLRVSLFFCCLIFRKNVKKLKTGSGVASTSGLCTLKHGNFSRRLTSLPNTSTFRKIVCSRIHNSNTGLHTPWASIYRDRVQHWEL